MMEFYLELRNFGRAIDLHAYKRQEDQIGFIAPVTYTWRVDSPETHGMIHEPFLTVPTVAAQILMDQLWNCGLRPSEGSGSAGALAATERHLADMRKIALDLLAQGARP